RFIRAAATERYDLLRHRDHLAAKRDGLLDELHRLDDALGELDQRVAILARLIGAPVEGLEGSTSVEPSNSLETISRGEAPGRLLRGPKIREAAVKALLDQPDYIEALHYRQWCDLLLDAGYAIAGKDPLAVFLTQITRSPVVRRSSQPGVYELD